MSAKSENDAIVLVSGGLDSCVSTAWAANEGYRLRLLHVSYGQRTEQREAKAFTDIAAYYSVPPERQLAVSVEYLARIGGSSLTDPTIEVERADLEREGIPNSYVPFRNTHLLAIAASWAEVVGAERIVIGAVHEDSSGYPDCTPAYYRAFNALLEVASARGRLIVETPLISLTKSQIVRLGRDLNAPLHLTWSCYSSTDVACGVCDSCALRLRGFQEAGVEDPIPYAIRPRYASTPKSASSCSRG